jgi:hypothetical protein
MGACGAVRYLKTAMKLAPLPGASIELPWLKSLEANRLR